MARAAENGAVVITGALGFIGRALVEVIRAEQMTRPIVAVDRKRGEAAAFVDCVECDMQDFASMRELLRSTKPSVVIHLAGALSLDDANESFDGNVVATHHLLRAIHESGSRPAVVLAGTAAQYGIDADPNGLVSESHPCSPVSFYGTTKHMQELWARTLAHQLELDVVTARIFNIMGPHQTRRLVPGAFLHQVADVERGLSSEVRVGNLETVRDFLDVRDVARALWALAGVAARCRGDTFNVASGEGTRVRDLLEAVVALATRTIPIKQDRDRLKKQDVACIVGDAQKLRRATGWEPQVTWQQSLRDAWSVLQNESGR